MSLTKKALGPSSGGDCPDRESADGDDHGRNAENPSRSGQGIRPSGMDTAHEQHRGDGRGIRAAGAGLRIARV